MVRTSRSVSLIPLGTDLWKCMYKSSFQPLNLSMYPYMYTRTHWQTHRIEEGQPCQVPWKLVEWAAVPGPFQPRRRRVSRSLAGSRHLSLQRGRRFGDCTGKSSRQRLHVAFSDVPKCSVCRKLRHASPCWLAWYSGGDMRLSS